MALRFNIVTIGFRVHRCRSSDAKGQHIGCEEDSVRRGVPVQVHATIRPLHLVPTSPTTKSLYQTLPPEGQTDPACAHVAPPTNDTH